MTSDSPEWGLPKHLTNKQTNHPPWELNEQSSCEAILTAHVDERNVDKVDDVAVELTGIMMFNSDIVNFTEPLIGEE